MKRKMWNSIGAAGCALLLAIPIMAANQPTPKANKTGTHKTTMTETVRHWRAETVSGKIMMVDPAKKLVVLKDTDGVPFDMVVTRSTRIESGNQMLKLSDLASKTNQSASIHFVPEGRGDVARSIQITG